MRTKNRKTHKTNKFKNFKITLFYMGKCVPVDEKDHESFKILAIKQKKSMAQLFHDIVEKMVQEQAAQP